MQRYYYVGKNLTDIENAEKALLCAGYSEPQIHVLSHQDAKIEQRKLHEVNVFARRDILHSGLMGAGFGAILAVIILLLAAMFHPLTATDWLPFVLLAVISFFFCAWEGGLYGFQNFNAEYKRFSHLLRRGYHVLMVDATDKDRDRIYHLMEAYTTLSLAGEGNGRPAWLISSDRGLREFVKAMP